MSAVLIIVSYANNLFGKLARLRGLHWTHCALIWEGEAFECSGALNVRCVRKRPLGEFIFEQTDLQFLKFKEPLYWRTAQEVGCFARASIGRGYDYGLLMTLALGREPKFRINREKYTCSSFLAHCFWSVGINLVPGIRADAVLPDHIANSPLLEKIDGG